VTVHVPLFNKFAYGETSHGWELSPLVLDLCHSRRACGWNPELLAMTKIEASGDRLRIVPLHMYKRPTRTSCKSTLSMSRISSPTPSRCQGFSQQIRYQANGQELSKPAFKLVKRAVRRGLSCRPSALRKEGLPGPYKSTEVSLSRPYGMSGHLGGHSRPDVSVAVSLGDNRVQRQAPFTTPLWRPGQGAEPAHGW
jgi:hypothetical protein